MIYVKNYGRIEYYIPEGRNLLFHRGNGLPAVTTPNGMISYYLEGVPHRADGLPAFIQHNVCLQWYVNGKRHRVNGLPAVQYLDRDVYDQSKFDQYWENDNLHRAGNLPARFYNGYEEYWENGVLYKKVKMVY